MITYIARGKRGKVSYIFILKSRSLEGEFLRFTAKPWDLVGLRLTGYQSCRFTLQIHTPHISSIQEHKNSSSSAPTLSSFSCLSCDFLALSRLNSFLLAWTSDFSSLNCFFSFFLSLFDLLPSFRATHISGHLLHQNIVWVTEMHNNMRRLYLPTIVDRVPVLQL